MLYTKIVLKSKYFCSGAIFWENPLDNCFCRLYTWLKKRKQIRSVTIKGEIKTSYYSRGNGRGSEP